MLGVILFVLILTTYGLILSTELLNRAFPQLASTWSRIDAVTSSGARRVILSFTAIIIGLWNLFAPDFGVLPEPGIIGALIPAAIMLFDACVIYPNIIEILNIPEEHKKKYYEFIDRYKGIAGIATFIIGLLHLGLYKIILF